MVKGPRIGPLILWAFPISENLYEEIKLPLSLSLW